MFYCVAIDHVFLFIQNIYNTSLDFIAFAQILSNFTREKGKVEDTKNEQTTHDQQITVGIERSTVSVTNCSHSGKNKIKLFTIHYEALVDYVFMLFLNRAIVVNILGTVVYFLYFVQARF